MKNQMQLLTEKINALEQEYGKLVTKAREKNIYPYQDKFASPQYIRMIRKTDLAAEKLLTRFFELDLKRKGPEHFSRENVFVWGGPTPKWGGSMAKDTSIKAKEFFDLDNVMYVYGPLNREMMDLHKDCKKLICHLGRNCRTKDAAMESDAEEAEFLSKLSLEYPNITGGVVDDMIMNYGKNYSLKEYRAIYEGLHKHNPDLELCSVVYAWELEQEEKIKIISEFIDHVILWFWSKTELLNFDVTLEKCRTLFRGKPIMLGIFMFDYGAACLPNSPATMNYHLEKARRALADGKIREIVILGDREIEKCPETARFIQEYLQKEFSK